MQACNSMLLCNCKKERNREDKKMYQVIFKNTKTHTTNIQTFATKDKAERAIWLELMSCDYMTAKLVEPKH